MTEANKRPTASRDITELKARLGLKKTGSMTAARPTVAPPPGLEGAAPGMPAPRVTEDPFGAMGAMAQQQTYAAPRAQEFVVVNDGQPVAQVQQGSKATRYLKFAGIALVPLVLGMLVGGAGKQNAIHNVGVKDAGIVLQDVASIRRDLVGLEALLAESRGKIDKKLTEQMTELLAKPFQPELIFRAQTVAIGATSAAQVNSFYAGVSELRELIKSHVALANQDDNKLTDAAKKAAAARYGDMAYRYAVVVTSPSEGQQGRFGAQLVELGTPTCTDANCSQVTGFEYSMNADGKRFKGDLAAPGSIEPQQIIPLLATHAMNGLVQGAEESAAEVHYRRRVTLIAEKLTALLESGSALEQRLKQVSNSGTRFTFFM